MIIRKTFKTEGPAHIVRNCTTDRCSKSIHGHSYEWEVKLKGSSLDNGGMIVDFGILKGEIGKFFDMFDHCHIIWDQDSDIEHFWNYSDRVIKAPFSPSAENMAVFAFMVCDRILRHTAFANGEHGVEVHSVTCHETKTGYAEAFADDVEMHNYYNLEEVQFKHDEGLWEALMYKLVTFVKDQIPVQVVDTRKERNE